jgi:hypothetical protein
LRKEEGGREGGERGEELEFLLALQLFNLNSSKLTTASGSELDSEVGTTGSYLLDL